MTGYATLVALASTALALALLIAVWGVLSLLLDRDVVETRHLPILTEPVVVALALGLLTAVLIVHARSRATGTASHPLLVALAAAAGVYLVLGMGGLVAGLPPRDSVLSPFAVAGAPIAAVTCLWTSFVVWWRMRVAADEEPPASESP